MSDTAAPPTAGRRISAALALVLPPALTILLITVAIRQFPRGLYVLAALVISLAAGWYGLTRRGARRWIGLGVSLFTLVVTVVLLILDVERPVAAAVVAVGLLAGLAAGRSAFRARAPLRVVEPPRNPVLFYNPKSGGGKAERFGLADEARARGIEPIELAPGKDLERLVRDAVAAGADGLAMAGGDGSQAIVAAVASEHGLPYACIPAGTRNHFALDLGVDRDDVVGALDAFVDGGERIVDLAEVNGTTFVNNVSLGLYAEAVQSKGYRDAKLRTILDTVPDVLGPEGEGLDLRWTGPSGEEHSSGAAILVSNNRYRLGKAIGSGTRPDIEDGLLGITIAAAPVGRGRRRRLPQRPWREWSTTEFEVRADAPVAAGIDGEAVHLEPPLRFRIRPKALRVRIAHAHPGLSPSAEMPENFADGVASLTKVAAGHDPGTSAGEEGER